MQLEIVLVILAAVASAIMNIGIHLAAWLMFTIWFYSSGGWFVRELGRESNWSSFPVFAVTVAAPAVVSPLLWPVAGYSFLAAILMRTLTGESTGTLSLRVARATFLALALVGVFLLLSSFATLLAAPAFVVSLVPFVLAGWFYPEVNRAIGASPSHENARSILLYIGILGIPASLVALYGPDKRYLASWVLLLGIAFLLRSALNQDESA